MNKWNKQKWSLWSLKCVAICAAMWLTTHSMVGYATAGDMTLHEKDTHNRAGCAKAVESASANSTFTLPTDTPFDPHQIIEYIEIQTGRPATAVVQEDIENYIAAKTKEMRQAFFAAHPDIPHLMERPLEDIQTEVNSLRLKTEECKIVRFMIQCGMFFSGGILAYGALTDIPQIMVTGGTIMGVGGLSLLITSSINKQANKDLEAINPTLEARILFEESLVKWETSVRKLANEAFPQQHALATEDADDPLTDSTFSFTQEEIARLENNRVSLIAPVEEDK